MKEDEYINVGNLKAVKIALEAISNCLFDGKVANRKRTDIMAALSYLADQCLKSIQIEEGK